MRDRVKELRRVPASELRANPKNWRRHPPAQEAALRGVLEDIGFADAVIARETPDGLELIDGHLRQEVMGDQVVPVLIVDVTEEEADKMLLTYDPLAMMAHADQDQLLHLLRDTQFESKAVNDMLEAVANGERLPMPDLTEPVEDPGPQIDRADELREKWQTERGQVWEVGRHRLMCGDSTVATNINTVLGVTHPEMMFTDPPYGVGYDGGHFHSGDVNIKRSRDRLAGDDDASVYAKFLRLALSVVDGPCYMFFAGSRGEAVYPAVVQSGGEIHALIIWHKVNATYAAMNAQYKQRHEPCLYFKPNGRTLRWCGPTDENTLWEIKRDAVNDNHPTQKPLALPLRALGNHSADTVFDPFLGSGTTMVAAEQLGRICYGMEIEPKYVAVTLERMSGMGLEPKLVGR